MRINNMLKLCRNIYIKYARAHIYTYTRFRNKIKDFSMLFESFKSFRISNNDL